MNQFKKDLNRELQSVSLSKETKQRIAMKAKAKNYSQKRRIHWQYRFVLVTFTVFALGFSYLLWQQDDSLSKSQSAAPIESGTTPIWSILHNDVSKTVLYISFFIILRTLIKRRLQKGGKGLPVCVHCGEEWSYREAFKQSMKITALTCPYCDQKQYRTKKSFSKGVMLGLFMPFMVFVPYLFDHSLLGIVVHASCTTYIMCNLSPYFMDLQEKDSLTDPLW